MTINITKLAVASFLVVAALPASAQYMLDDGTGEQNIGIGAAGDLVWMNQFTVAAGQEVITSVDLAFGTAGTTGLAINVGIWDDPNNDGDPGDAILLSSLAGVSANEGTDIFNNFVVSSNVGTAGDSFFVGAWYQENANGTDFLIRNDTTSASAVRSFAGFNSPARGYAGGALGGMDVYGETGTLGLPGNYMIRANAVPEPASMIALGAGLAALVSRRRRKKA